MRLDLCATEDWERACEAAREGLDLSDPTLSVRVHSGLGTAVFECALTIAQVYSHKRAFAVVKGNSPAFDHVVPWFLKETYQSNATLWKDLANPAEWVASLPKETAFALIADDQPVTGELSAADELDTLLNERKIFVLRVSHSSFIRPGLTARPYTLRLCSVDDTLAFSVGGSRLRITPAISDRRRWSPLEVASRIERRLKSGEDRAAVEAFESQFPKNKWNFSNPDRLYDRAILLFPDVSGEALTAKIRSVMGPLSEHDLDTTNLCRWDSTRLLKKWWADEPSEEVLRGLVVFSAWLCRRKDFAKIVSTAYEDLLKLQTW